MDKPLDPRTPFREVYQPFLDDLGGTPATDLQSDLLAVAA